jgi:hypothetical protein
LSFEVPVAEMPKWLPGAFHFAFRVSGIPDAVEEHPLFLLQWNSLELPVAEMPKWLLGTFTFRASGFGVSRCSGRKHPLSLELPVAEMPKWLLGAFTFHASGFGVSIPDAVEESTPLSLESR